MALNKRIAFVGLDRQVSGKGTLAATAAYGLGLRGGGVLAAEIEQDYEEVTSTSRLPPSAYRSGVNPGASFTTRVWNKSAGLLYLGALGAISTTGTNPYTHVITPAATLPYLTLFSRLDTEYHKVRDCAIGELGLSWSGREPPELSVTVAGTVGTYYTTSWSATNDDSVAQAMSPVGGTFKVETIGTTPAPATVTGGTITISNNLIPVLDSSKVEPDDQWPGLHQITVSLTVIPADTNLWQQILTGSGSATAATATPQYGSFQTTFLGSGGATLDLTAPRIAFLGEYPEADPGGGPVELELEGTVVIPTSGAAFTATLINATASYPGS
jgi:hypothetical protein